MSELEQKLPNIAKRLRTGLRDYYSEAEIDETHLFGAAGQLLELLERSRAKFIAKFQDVALHFPTLEEDLLSFEQQLTMDPETAVNKLLLEATKGMVDSAVAYYAATQRLKAVEEQNGK